MQTPSTPTPLTFGKLLTRAITFYPTHKAILLRTAAIFYLPVAALSYLLVHNLTTNLIFSLLFWPVDAIVSLALIVHCIDSLHGRPLAVRTAVMRGLPRLPAYLGLGVIISAVTGAVALVLASPLWVGFLNSGVSLDELLDAFAVPATPGQVDVVFSVLGSALWGGTGLCLSGLLIPTVLFYLAVRWRFAEIALMAEEMGPLQSLRRSWHLSRGFVLRTLGYLLLILIMMGIIGGLTAAFVGFAMVSLAPAADQAGMFGFNYAVSKLMFILAAPFYVSAIVLYYFDLRVRKEKYDSGIV